MTSCFVYNVMGLTFHDRINTRGGLLKHKEHYLGSNLTGCSFLFFFFSFFFGGGGGWGRASGLILLFSSCLILFSFYYFFYYFFYPFNTYKVHI